MHVVVVWQAVFCILERSVASGGQFLRDDFSAGRKAESPAPRVVWRVYCRRSVNTVWAHSLVSRWVLMNSPVLHYSVTFAGVGVRRS